MSFDVYTREFAEATEEFARAAGKYLKWFDLHPKPNWVVEFEHHGGDWDGRVRLLIGGAVWFSVRTVEVQTMEQKLVGRDLTDQAKRVAKVWP